MTDLLTAEISPTVLTDVTPAEVETPDGTVLGRCRAIVTASRLYVLTWPADRTTPAVMVEVEHSSTEAPPRGAPRSAAFIVRTADGIFYVRRGPGCLCSYRRLANYRLFDGAARA